MIDWPFIMLAMITQVFNRLIPLVRWSFKIAFFLVLAIMLFWLLEGKLWPRMATWPWFERLGLVTDSNRVTVIEKKESVTVAAEEGFEHILIEEGATTVGVLEVSQVGAAPRAVVLPSAPLATGVFVTNDGLVVTFFPELQSWRQKQFALLLQSGETVTAEVAGYDTMTHLLFLRVARANTPAIAFANSADIKAGRRVALLLATPEATLGIWPSTIVAVDRAFNIAAQTVASSEAWEGVLRLPLINTPSLTGSPAFLLNGELAGIVGERRVDTITIPFLIPANTVRESLNRLIAGHMERPKVGLTYLSITPNLQMTLGLGRDRGALVYSLSGRTGLAVLAGSPAARAGLQFGDMIIAVNGAEINLDLPLSVALGRYASGETVQLLVIRDGVEREIVLSL